MISSLVTPGMPVIVQGLTGRTGRDQTFRMLKYGTNIVGGVSPRPDDSSTVRCFRSCAEAVAQTGAKASVVIVPPVSVLSAIREAVESGIGLIVTITEGMPIHDALKARSLVREAGARWIGASTPGLAIPGKIKLGFLPDMALAAGSLGVMSKSGTLAYEVCHRLVARGMGQSLWVGVGGDPVKGTRFADLLPIFADDPETDAVVIIGEIGGDEEEELAGRLLETSFSKPVFALLAGRNAREGVTMGHAGALVGESTGDIGTKASALEAANATVCSRMEELVVSIADTIQHKAERATDLGLMMA